MFWDDSTEEAAKISLRVALAGLRKALTAENILADRSTLQINPEFCLWVDVLEFKTLAGRHASFDDLQTAAALRNPPAGDFLEQFYDDWVIYVYNSELPILGLGSSEARLFWGFQNGPAWMTTDGKRIFLNLLMRLLAGN